MDNNVRPQDLTLVVGGGPAGTSCAWKLASVGRECLIIDKARFPRDKVCGGVLSPAAAETILDSGILTLGELEELTLRKHGTLALWNRDELLRTYTSDDSTVRIVSRKEFDNVLLEKAAAAGTSIITEDAVLSLDSSSVLTAAGRRLSFSNLVGADGCNSVVSKFISGKRNRKTGLGLEYFIPFSHFGEIPQEIQIHFGHIPYGYIWVIPGKEMVNVGGGAIGSTASPSDITLALNTFLEGNGISFADYQLQGASIPSLALERNLGRGNIYLAGDAAGLTDHVSGEGIGHAVQSGFLVAECIQSEGDRRTVLRKRGNRINVVRQSMFFRHLLFSPITFGIAMMELRDNEAYARGYWNIISGKDSYSGMFTGLLESE